MEKLNEKEKRIKAAYQDGIDTLEEYRQNKTLIQSERERLAEQLRILEAALQRPDAGEHQEEMLLRIRSVVDILCSDASKDVKSRSIRSICDKIVFDRASKTLDIYCVFRIL